MPTKKCSICKLGLPDINFNKRTASKDGLLSECKVCRKDIDQKYRDNHKGKILLYNKQYYIINKEAIVISVRQYQRENKCKAYGYRKKFKKSDKGRLAALKYREKNKEKIAMNARIYNSQHMSLGRIRCQRRRSLKRSLASLFTADQWDKCKIYFNNSCAYCGEVSPLEQDHFLAISKNGEYTKDNIVPACKACNVRKRDHDFFIWYPKYKHYSKKREKKILDYLGYHKGSQQLSFV